MLLALVLLPLALGGLAFLLPSERLRPWLLPIAGTVHLILTSVAIAGGARPRPFGNLQLDPLGTLVLCFTIDLFFL